MKYLNDYTNEATTVLLENTGAFFAFSNQQFDEKKIDGVKYVNAGAGLIVPIENVDALIEGLKQITTEGIAKDKAENGDNAIIARELANHECYYTGDIDGAVSALENYGYTTEQILDVFKKTKTGKRKQCNDTNY